MPEAIRTSEPGPGRVVVALGGNAILQRGQKGSADEQFENIRVTAWHIAQMVHVGWRVVVTHGNGPQVGNILLQNEEARHVVPALPLDVCGAESQGLIGYMLVQALRNELRARGLAHNPACLVTQVVVDPEDPAFRKPTKPVGPFYTDAQAKRLTQTKGWQVVNTGPKGWRRVVPSPDPQTIVEIEAIRDLIAAGLIVVACGGGGIPVARGAGGQLYGVEAVIDKDLASERLATELGADELLILTDIEQVQLDYGQPSARPVDRLTLEQGRALIAEGQFPAGSMGPKIEACLRFVAHGGRRATVANLARAMAALRGQAGTSITQG
ncbi:MAG: carbamate kinase [Bacillota bacterium]|nr:carbamate kinase [Bacillota bacterium]